VAVLRQNAGGGIGTGELALAWGRQVVYLTEKLQVGVKVVAAEMERQAGGRRGGGHVNVHSGTCTAELGIVARARVGAVACRSAGATEVVAAVALGMELG